MHRRHAVMDIMFDRSVMLFPALKDEPTKLAAFRAELDGFVARYFENNVVRQHCLMTRATKK